MTNCPALRWGALPTKSDVLKVFRIAVFSNINYHSIEYICIVYKSKIFMEISQQVFSTNTSFRIQVFGYKETDTATLK